MLNLLAAITLAIILFAAKSDTFQLQTTGAAMLYALSLEDLSRKAELIVKGEVLGKVESITTEFYNNSVSVDKVIKGTQAGNTINVLTRPSEFTSDGVVLTKGENVILFLSKEKMYGGYIVVGLYQGKFNIDPNGVVYNYEYGYEIKNMSLPEMEKNITEAGYS